MSPSLPISQTNDFLKKRNHEIEKDVAVSLFGSNSSAEQQQQQKSGFKVEHGYSGIMSLDLLFNYEQKKFLLNWKEMD